MQSKSSFVLSGLISFSFYVLLAVLVIYYLSSPEVQTFAIKQNETVIELDMINEVSDKKMVEEKTEKKIEKKEEVVEKTASKSAEEEKKPDINSLFANVKETAKTVAKEEVTDVEKTLPAKRYKAKFEKEKRSNNQTIDKLLTDKKTTTTQKKSNASKGESNKYYDAVLKLLYAWPGMGEGLKAVVRVTIQPDGRFDYKFVDYSSDEAFNISLKDFLEEQKNIQYPIPESNKSITIDVDFKSEG